MLGLQRQKRLARAATAQARRSRRRFADRRDAVRESVLRFAGSPQGLATAAAGGYLVAGRIRGKVRERKERLPDRREQPSRPIPWVNLAINLWRLFLSPAS